MNRFKVIFLMMALVTLSWQSAGAVAVNATAGGSKQKIKEVSQLIKREPKNGQAYASRAALRFEMQDMYGAIKDYSAAIKLSPVQNSLYLLGRANAFLEIGAYKEALEDFTLGLEIETSTDLLYGRAVARYFLYDYFGALRDLDQVIASEPKHSKALYNRAVVKMELKQLPGAAEDLTSFLSHFPGHLEAERALAAADAVLQKQRPAR